MVGDFLKLVAEHGLSVVLLFVLGWAYDRQQKKHEAERLVWNKERDVEQAKWEAERLRYEAERRVTFAAEKEDGERIQSILMKMQDNASMMINKASDMASAFEQEKKEIRDRAERDIREQAARDASRSIPGRAR